MPFDGNTLTTIKQKISNVCYKTGCEIYVFPYLFLYLQNLTIKKIKSHFFSTTTMLRLRVENSLPTSSRQVCGMLFLLGVVVYFVVVVVVVVVVIVVVVVVSVVNVVVVVGSVFAILNLIGRNIINTGYKVVQV